MKRGEKMSKFKTYKKICLMLPESEETYPFGPENCVIKVNGKIFAILDEIEISLKCNPDLVIDYREMYEGVKPGYHLNKKHWNTVVFDSDVKRKAMIEMIIHSYKCVVGKMTKAVKDMLFTKLSDQMEFIK